MDDSNIKKTKAAIKSLSSLTLYLVLIEIDGMRNSGLDVDDMPIFGAILKTYAIEQNTRINYSIIEECEGMVYGRVVEKFKAIMRKKVK